MMTNLKAKKEGGKKTEISDWVWGISIFLVILGCFYGSIKRYLENKKYFPEPDQTEYQRLAE